MIVNLSARRVLGKSISTIYEAINYEWSLKMLESGSNEKIFNTFQRWINYHQIFFCYFTSSETNSSSVCGAHFSFPSNTPLVPVASSSSENNTQPVSQAPDSKHLWLWVCLSWATSICAFRLFLCIHRQLLRLLDDDFYFSPILLERSSPNSTSEPCWGPIHPPPLRQQSSPTLNLMNAKLFPPSGLPWEQSGNCLLRLSEVHNCLLQKTSDSVKKKKKGRNTLR